MLGAAAPRWQAEADVKHTIRSGDPSAASDGAEVRAFPDPGHRSEPARRRSVTPVHSGEIAARTFRTTFRGLDPVEVREWLTVVEASHEALEDELDRIRDAWEDLLLASAHLRAAAASGDPLTAERWNTLASAFRATRPDAELEGSSTGFARAALDDAMRGRGDARAALLGAVTHLARLQHENTMLRRDNDALRQQLIDTLVAIGVR